MHIENILMRWEYLKLCSRGWWCKQWIRSGSQGGLSFCGHTGEIWSNPILTLCLPAITQVLNSSRSFDVIGFHDFVCNFLKPFLKGKILRSSERGVNSILTTILRFWPTSWTDRIFCLVASDSARREDHFQKRNCPKRTFPSNFVKLVSKILYLFLAEKIVVCCCLLLFVVVVVVVCCNFVRFWLTFFLNWSTHRAEKDASKEKIIRCTVWELLNP